MSEAGIARRLVGLALAGLLAVAIAGCSPVYRNHGYIPSDEELSLIEVGKDTRDTVAATLGRPSSQGLLNDVGWFYVQSRWKHYGALAPQEIDRQVVAITFTEDGVVDNIARYGLEDGRAVEISRRVTESNIKGLGFIRQLFNSIGRIRGSDVVGD